MYARLSRSAWKTHDSARGTRITEGGVPGNESLLTRSPGAEFTK